MSISVLFLIFAGLLVVYVGAWMIPPSRRYLKHVLVSEGANAFQRGITILLGVGTLAGLVGSGATLSVFHLTNEAPRDPMIVGTSQTASLGETILLAGFARDSNRLTFRFGIETGRLRALVLADPQLGEVRPISLAFARYIAPKLLGQDSSEYPNVQIGLEARDTHGATARAQPWPVTLIDPADKPIFQERQKAALKKIKNKDYDSSASSFSKALQIAPNSYQSLVGRGYAFAKLGRVSVSLADFGRAIAVTRGKVSTPFLFRAYACSRVRTAPRSCNIKLDIEKFRSLTTSATARDFLKGFEDLPKQEGTARLELLTNQYATQPLAFSPVLVPRQVALPKGLVPATEKPSAITSFEPSFTSTSERQPAVTTYEPPAITQPPPAQGPKPGP